MSAPRNPAVAAPLLGLEIMRFVCAVSVLIWHHQHFYVVGAAHVGYVPSQQPGFDWLKPFYLHGWLGVQAFWALSGFIFFWKYAQPVSQGRVRAGRFAWLRFSRLYPLHLVTLLAVLPLIAWYRAQTGQDYVYQHNDASHFLRQLLLASDWDGRSEWSFNGPIWSISIEVLAYAVFFTLSKLGWVRPWQIAAVIGATGVVYALKLTPHPLVLCLFFFYLGGLTHAAWRRMAKLGGTHQASAWWGVALALLGGTALVAAGRLPPMFYVALLAPLAMLVLLRLVRTHSATWQARLTLLGHTTYGSYLLHFPLQLLVANLSGAQPERLPLQHPAWLLGYLVLTFALAAASHRWIEAPAQEALRAWGERRLFRSRA
ncbi:MAG: acyltransferase [Burkholderiales bacterium]|nr:acyltransferase [Burkholderiales bacterium]MBH2016756.1 acyltransferase [Burkholderiales bacterium]